MLRLFLNILALFCFILLDLVSIILKIKNDIRTIE